MQLDDAAADGQPHPHTLWFGGEEGLVQSFGRPGPKPGAGIVDGHLAHPVIGPRRVNADLPGIVGRLADGVDRVLQDIHDDLLDLDTIGEDPQLLRRQLEPHRDLRLLHFPDEPLDRVVDNLGEVRRLDARRAPLHELAQVVHDLAGPQRFGSGVLEQREEAGRLQLAPAHVGRTCLDLVGDRREGLIQLVREPARHMLDGRDPEHVCQLGLMLSSCLFRPLALGDVAERPDEPATEAVVERADVELHRKDRPVLPPAADLMPDAEGLRVGRLQVARDAVSTVRLGREHRHGLSDHLAAGVAEHLLGGRVERKEGAALVDRDDAVHGRPDTGPRHGFALAQDLLGALAFGDVLDGQKDEIGPATAAGQGARVEQQGPAAALPDLVLDFDARERPPVAQDLAQRLGQRRRVLPAVAQLVHEPVYGCVRSQAEGLVEGAVGRLHPQLGVQHQQGFPDRVHDGLGIESGLLERLCSDVRESDHDAIDPVVVRAIGQNLPDVPPAVSTLDLLADRGLAGKHELGIVQEVGVDAALGEVADRPAHVRGDQVEEPGRDRREPPHVEGRVEEDGRDVGAGQQVVQVVVRLLQLCDLVLELRVDGVQLLVERVQLLLGGLELLVAGA